MLATLEELGLDIFKTPASTSGVLQPADVSPVFKALKKLISSAPPTTDFDDLVVGAAWKDALQGIREEVPIATKTINRLTTLVATLHCHLPTAFTSRNIKMGFEKSGVHPFRVEQIMNQARPLKPLKLTEKEALVQKIKALVDLARFPVATHMPLGLGSGTMSPRRIWTRLGCPAQPRTKAQRTT